MKKAAPDSALALERARLRLGAVGAIAGLITHQVRNRLATIRGALELLAEGLDDDLSPEYRAALLREIDHVIGDFNLGTDMLRGGAVAPVTLSARQMAEETVAPFRAKAEAAGVALELSPGAGTDEVAADRRLLRVVLLNLLDNAATALVGRDGAQIKVLVGRTDSEVTWEIADNGPGLPPVIYDRWEQEPRSSDELAGLGLTLCRDAMLLMGGSIRYLTPRGQPGARFLVSLPAAS